MDNDHNDTNDLFHGELVRFLTESQEMRVAAKSSLKHSLWAGAGAFAGAMALGPVGGLVGGVAGSVAGFLQSDPYDGAVLAILKLQGQQREVLLKDIKKVLVTAGATVNQLEDSKAFREALYQFAAKDTVRNNIWKACMSSIDD